MLKNLKIAREKKTAHAAPSQQQWESASSSAPGPGPGRHDFSSIPVLRPQAKLTVNRVGDAREQEADQVADRVMRVGPAATVQRAPKDEEEEKVQKKPISGSRTPLAQRTGDDSPAQDVSEIVRSGLSSGGAQLDGQTRGFMESRFGHDFSDVRIHTDSQASQSAETISARAYTVGSDVAFRSGEYAPGSSEGQRLLAHELTHVVQQGGAHGGQAIQRAAEDEEAKIEPPTATAAPVEAAAPVAAPAPATSLVAAMFDQGVMAPIQNAHDALLQSPPQLAEARNSVNTALGMAQSIAINAEASNNALLAARSNDLRDELRGEMLVLDAYLGHARTIPALAADMAPGDSAVGVRAAEVRKSLEPTVIETKGGV